MIFTSNYLLEKVLSQSCVYFFVGTSASRSRIIAIKCLSLLLAKKKRETLGDALVISDTAQINRIIPRVVKAEKRKGKLTRWMPRLQRTNGQFSIVHASLGFLLNTAFHPSYALSFVSPVHTQLLPGYFFPSPYMYTPSVLYVKSQLNSVIATVKLGECEMIDEQSEQVVRSSDVLSL